MEYGSTDSSTACIPNQAKLVAGDRPNNLEIKQRVDFLGENAIM